MAKGHKPLTNRQPTPRRDRRERNEAAVLTAPNRQTLPYYRPIQRGTAIMQEAGILDGADVAVPQGPLLDAAAASFGETTVLEVVFGNDDRVRVADNFMRTNPWRQICALRITSQSNRTYVGTAWFISPTTLATAGHCVFMQNDGGWAKSIDVIPGKIGPTAPFGRIRSESFASVDGWVEQRQRDFDYGVIFLPDPVVGRRVGNFEVQVLADPELSGVTAKVSGYPADRDRAEFQYFHERPVTSVTSTRIEYDIDTFGGQSGSPIFQHTDNGIVAIGIHTTGGATSNSGTRISDPVMDNLILWTRER
jgi:glutamyl endopeptidase